MIISAVEITGKEMAEEIGWASARESLAFEIALKDTYSVTLGTREDGQETDGC